VYLALASEGVAMAPEPYSSEQPASGSGAEVDPHQKTSAELLKDLSTQLTGLIHQELELAKAELGQKTKRMGLGAGLFGGAGLLAVFGLAAMVTAAIAGLAQVVAVWAAALIVAGALLAIAGVLALTGKTEVQQGSPPVPEEAIQSTKEDVAWLKTQTRSAKR
jgi:uncharacterized membrane protein YqjE